MFQIFHIINYFSFLSVLCVRFKVTHSINDPMINVDVWGTPVIE